MCYLEQLALDLVKVVNYDTAPAERFAIMGISPSTKYNISLNYIGQQSQGKGDINLYTTSDASRMAFVGRLREAQESNQWIRTWGSSFDVVTFDLRTEKRQYGVPNPTWANVTFASPFGK